MLREVCYNSCMKSLTALNSPLRKFNKIKILVLCKYKCNVGESI